MNRILNYLRCSRMMFLKTLFFLTLLVVMINNANATTDAWARPYEIKFNYEGASCTNDAITIRKADGTAATIPEWKYSTRNYKFAYIKSQSNRKIQVSIDSNCDDMHLVINLKVTSGTGLGEVCNYFVANYHKKDWITLDLDGLIPGTVDIRTFTWEWEIYVLPDDISTYCAASTTTNTTHTYYTLLDMPTAPIAEPWVSVLEYACDWAGGQSIESNCVQKIVESFYDSSGFLYDVIDGSSRYSGITNTDFNLTYMISDLGSNNTSIIVNCYDMGKAVDIFASAVGCNTDYALSYPFGYLNCVKPIGRGWANNPFYEFNTENTSPVFSSNPIVGEDDDYWAGRSNFGNHAFCELNDIIFDACLKVDIDNNPDAAPHVGSWATNWSWLTYKNRVIDNYPASNPPSQTLNYTYSIY